MPQNALPYKQNATIIVLCTGKTTEYNLEVADWLRIPTLPHSIFTLMGFYEEIALDYDQMTRFEERMQRETALFNTWIVRYRFQSAVDVACGTGLHAILLAQAGIQTVGADISAEMLEQAKQHAEKDAVQISWIHAGMEQTRQYLEGSYDAVFCLGNSLPHLLNSKSLHAAFMNFSQLLSPGGIAVIQILNYSRILVEQERIVGIHRNNSAEYIRFYDFLPEYIRFNLLTVRWEQGKARHSLSSTTLYPYQQDELENALHEHQFSEIEWYGNMEFQPFDKSSSPNLVIVARKMQ
ncbi:hypothetical protein CSA56_10135 [candidate division KSB3 bacterium]|uniref:Methyltransferase domain-containing protein n=1 Tax=candidate division KSB3 bacterium TaxID=2044937 RepID=A0A2G6KEQ0_9BACT|nr:MAG: hypothetical protein CSA56_10135 [candidate division KSB3 bacterium]